MGSFSSLTGSFSLTDNARRSIFSVLVQGFEHGVDVIINESFMLCIALTIHGRQQESKGLANALKSLGPEFQEMLIFQYPGAQDSEIFGP